VMQSLVERLLAPLPTMVRVALGLSLLHQPQTMGPGRSQALSS